MRAVEAVVEPAEQVFVGVFVHLPHEVALVLLQGAHRKVRIIAMARATSVVSKSLWLESMVAVSAALFRTRRRR